MLQTKKPTLKSLLPQRICLPLNPPSLSLASSYLTAVRTWKLITVASKRASHLTSVPPEIQSRGGGRRPSPAGVDTARKLEAYKGVAGRTTPHCLVRTSALLPSPHPGSSPGLALSNIVLFSLQPSPRQRHKHGGARKEMGEPPCRILAHHTRRQSLAPLSRPISDRQQTLPRGSALSSGHNLELSDRPSTRPSTTCPPPSLFPQPF